MNAPTTLPNVGAGLAPALGIDTAPAWSAPTPRVGAAPDSWAPAFWAPARGTPYNIHILGTRVLGTRKGHTYNIHIPGTRVLGTRKGHPYNIHILGTRVLGTRKGRPDIIHIPGTRKACPYAQPDDEMDVIGHDDEFIQVNGGVTSRQSLPDVIDDPHDDRIVQYAFAVLRAYGDKIRASAGIIESFQADGTAMVFLRIVFHGIFCVVEMGSVGAGLAPTPGRPRGSPLRQHPPAVLDDPSAGGQLFIDVLSSQFFGRGHGLPFDGDGMKSEFPETVGLSIKQQKCRLGKLWDISTV